MSTAPSPPTGGLGKARKRKRTAGRRTGALKARHGQTSQIVELKDEGFFKVRRTLPQIQKRLEEQGHIYAQSSLSPVLVRLVRKRTLRRLKEKDGWAYVN